MRNGRALLFTAAMAGSLVFGASFLRAQDAAGGPPPGGPGRPFNNMRSPQMLQDTLSLTDRQLTELTDLRDEHNKKVQEIQGKLRDLEAQRRAQMKSATPNAAEIGSIALQIQNLQQQLEQENANYHTQALSVLDSGQRETVSKIEEALKLAPKAGALMQFGLLDMQNIRGGMGGIMVQRVLPPGAPPQQ